MPMIMRPLLVVFALITVAGPAAAAGKSRLAGRYGFDTSGDPYKKHCARIGQTRAVELQSSTYRCKTILIGEGMTTLFCELADAPVSDVHVGWMIFDTPKACVDGLRELSLGE